MVPGHRLIPFLLIRVIRVNPRPILRVSRLQRIEVSFEVCERPESSVYAAGATFKKCLKKPSKSAELG